MINGSASLQRVLTIITTDTGKTQVLKVGHEISHAINAPSYTYHGDPSCKPLSRERAICSAY